MRLWPAGALRSKHGPSGSFWTALSGIGKWNYGYEYLRRYTVLRDSLKSRFPTQTDQWFTASADRKIGSDRFTLLFNGDFFVANNDRFARERRRRRMPSMIIGEFGAADNAYGYTSGCRPNAPASLRCRKRRKLSSVLPYSPVFG